MFEWLFLLFAPTVPYADAPPTATADYVGLVAAEAAYAALLPSAPNPDKPKPPPVDPANCPTCKGTKRVPTGDSNNPWTKCPTCQPVTERFPVEKMTLPPGPFVKPPKNAASAPVAPAATCPADNCRVEKAAPSAPRNGIPFVPVPVAPWRFFRRK